MLRASGRAWMALVLFATLLLPVAGSHADSNEDKLAATKEKLERVRERIDALEGASKDIKEQIQGINQAIVDLQIDIRKLDTEIAKIETRVRNTQARIDATQARIDRIRGLATEQAVELYKSGTTDTLDALLDSRSIAELEERIEFLGVAAKRNTGALVKYGRLRLQIEEQNRELLAHKEALDGTRAQRAEVLATERALRDKLARKLEDLKGKIEKHRDEEAGLEKAAQEITADILRAQSLAAVVVPAGESASGYIWPLNGRVTSYYGPRWGRMHSGIDIDGASGQPIVSSKTGRVILAQHDGSGYGLHVVVDHGGGYATLYAHMSQLGTSVGEAVQQGEVIGYVGCTGSCTGDHLHFEIRVNGNPVDPLPYLP